MIKKLIEKRGPISIYNVDALQLRDTNVILQEFSDYAIHSDFNIIPNDEVWVDSRSLEQQYLIYEALTRIKYEELGSSKEHAYDKAEQKNKARREKEDNVKMCPWNYSPVFDEDIKKQIYLKKWTTIKCDDDIHVFIINGNFVRDYFKTDFVEGGHYIVYKWIPKNEIWIDDEVSVKEWILILIHEIAEMIMMQKNGFDYEKGHRKASKIEWSFRERMSLK
jgi:hypothetical protein